MRVLITGVAGFIGSHLAEACLARGDEVIGIDNLSTGRADNIPGGVDFRKGDIRNVAIFPVARPPDVIYHAAASYKDRDAWERDASTNVLGTINVIRYAQLHHARLIYFQTSLCYGPKPLSPVYPDHPLGPRGSYAVSKTAGETYIRDSSVEWVSLRLANVYGPRNLSGPVPTFYKRLTEGLPCTVVDSRRDFIFVDDLVELALRTSSSGRGIYHVSTGQDMAIAALYAEVARATGIDGAEPTFVSRGPDDVATILLDPSETYLEFGWTARTPLVTGVKAAVDWYRAHGVTETFTHLAMKG